MFSFKIMSRDSTQSVCEACADVPDLNPKISTFHNTLKEIPPGNDEEVQKLADKCGMDAKVLVQYHSLIHSRNAKVAESASKPPQGSDCE